MPPLADQLAQAMALVTEPQVDEPEEERFERKGAGVEQKPRAGGWHGRWGRTSVRPQHGQGGDADHDEDEARRMTS